MTKTYKTTKGFIVSSVIIKLPMAIFLTGLLSGLIMLIFILIGAGLNNFPFPGFHDFVKSLIISILFGIGYLVYNVYWGKSIIFGIEEDELRLTGGILRRFDITSKVDTITDVAIFQDFWGRIFHFYNVYLKRGQSFAEVSFFGVEHKDAVEIRDFIRNKINKDPERKIGFN